MKLLKLPSFGLDPEVFVKKGDKVVCPMQFSTMPKVVTPTGPHGGYNRDGMALELNPAPSHIITEVASNLHKLLAEAVDMAKLHGLTISHDLGMNIGTADDSVPMPTDVWEIGCDPDFNAYTGEVNRVQVDPAVYLDRFGGGHIHIGVGELVFKEACELVKLFDFHAGLLSVMYGNTTTSKQRRQTYGKAGAFRFDEEHGRIEYRVPDNSWLWIPEGFETLCSKMSDALAEFRAGIRMGDPTNIIQAINECDQDLAADLMGDPFCEAKI